MSCRVRVPFSRFIHASEVHRAERVKTSKHNETQKRAHHPGGRRAARRGLRAWAPHAGFMILQ
jgi:hypothetical protein